MLIQVTHVSIPAGSTIGFGEGIDEEGRVVKFVGDHRPMYHVGLAIGGSEGPVDVEIEDWQVQSIEESV
jgi:hypothetical protein